MLVLWRKPLNVETADYVQIPWVWPRGILPKTQKRSNAPRAGHAFATNPLLSPWVALGLPGGRPLGMAADTRIIRTTLTILIYHKIPLCELIRLLRSSPP